MKRYERYITPVNGDSFPSIALGFAVESSRICPYSEGTRVVDSLERWAVVAAIGSNGVYTSRREFAGTEKTTFWNAVDALLEQKKTIWAFADNCLSALTMLGVWELLEQGELELRWSGNANKQNIPSLPEVRPTLVVDARVEQARLGLSGVPKVRRDQATRGNTIRPRRRKRGSMDAKISCILEDTPTMIWLKRPGQKGSIKFLDIGNYGMSVPPMSVDVQGRASLTLDIVGKVIGAVKKNRLGSLQITSAGQALHAFRRRFLHDPILVHTCASALKLEGESYVGGRCECLRIGRIEGVTTQFDYRSMYAACYAENPVPIALKDTGSKAGRILSGSTNAASRCIACCLIETDEPAYPFRQDGIVIWPIGRFRATICGPELLDAVEHDRIKEVYHVATYAISHALSDYAKALHEMRCESDSKGDSDLSSFFKVLLVSLPGKLAGRCRRWIDSPSAFADKPYGRWVARDKHGLLLKYRSIAWNVQREIDVGWSNNAVPAVASWVTSLARMKLLNAIRLAGWDGVFYMDTDALLVNHAAAQRLRSRLPVSSGMLGSFQEKGTSEGCEIYGIKHYRFGGRIVCAGLPKGTTQVEGRDGVYYRREGTAEQAMEGNRPKSGGWYYTRRNASTYNHGLVDATGTVHPFVIREG